MSIPIITKGATTDHGGIVEECFETFTIDGKQVHLDGMKHYCPKCQKEVFAIASNHTKTIMGKAWVLEGDKASCGATFIANQSMGFVGSGKDNSNELGKLENNLNENVIGDIFDEQLQFIFDGETKDIYKFLSYNLKIGEKTYEGKLDENGKTPRFETEKSEEIKDIQIFFSGEIKNFSDYPTGE